MEVKSNKIGEIRKFYRQKLSNLYTDNESDSFLFMLFSDFAGLSKSDVVLNPEKTVSESELLKIHFAVNNLLNNKPIQYILGKTEFYGLTFEINPDVLIPRPETEELVEIVIKYSKPKTDLHILDIGTGSGCIAVSLKKHLPDAVVSAIDISGRALEVAKKNAINNSVDISFRTVDFLNLKARERLSKYDIIVSNPPYISKGEMPSIKKNVLDYEPAIALFPEGDDPLIFYRTISEFAKKHLKKNGKVYCEINQYLSEQTADIFFNNSFEKVDIIRDINNNDRIIVASLF